MSLKKIFLVICIGVLPFSFARAMETQKENPIEKIKSFKKVSVVIPSMEFTNDVLFDFLFMLKRGSYSIDDYNELNQEQKMFLEKTLQIRDKLATLEKMQLNLITNQLTSFLLQPQQIDPFSLLLSTLQNSKKTYSQLEKDIDPIIFSTIEEQKKQSYKRLSDLFMQIESLEKLKKEPDRLFIIVFPEAFFNFFKNPSGFGNFIPFFDEERKFMQIVANASSKLENIVFFVNFVHASEKQNISFFDKNFQQFINSSYDQKEILSTHLLYGGLDIIPVFNETFIFYKGAELGRYKKQFILDEDIPLMKSIITEESYLGHKRLLYIPGLSEQENINNLFAVEVCQDHKRIQKRAKTNFLIVQSASIDIIFSNLQNTYEGVCIHADIDKDKSNVYSIANKKVYPVSKSEVSGVGYVDLVFKFYNLN